MTRSKYISGESTAKAIPPKHSALQSLEKAASSSGRSSPAHEPPNGEHNGCIGAHSDINIV